MIIQKSSDTAIRSFIEQHPNWHNDNGRLYREFVFESFSSAFGFMAEVALFAERTDHHPEWCNIYNKVLVHLTTHEAHGISERDFELARTMELIASKR